MTDAELQAQYPLPPDVREQAETMLNGGTPVFRPAATGLEQMTDILKKLRQDALDTITALEDCPEAETVRHAALTQDLADIRAEIAHYVERLHEYEAKKQQLN